ncbi:hypothetical protein MVR51_001852, partial [Neisseria gonorrhoeae]
MPSERGFRRHPRKCYNIGFPLFFQAASIMCNHHPRHSHDNDTIRIRGARTHNLKNI